MEAITDLQLRLLRKFRAFPSQSIPSTEFGRKLVGISSRYGFAVIAGPDNRLISVKTSDLQALQSDNFNELNTFPKRDMDFFNLQAEIFSIEFNSDDRVLAVAANTPNGPFVYVFDGFTFHPTYPQQPFPLTSIRLAANNSAKLTAFEWNPCIPEIFATSTTDGLSTIQYALNNLKSYSIIGNQTLKSVVTCISWNPKGKQLAIGDADGKVHQLKPELVQVRACDHPSSIPGLGNPPYQCIGICWLSTTEWAVVHSSPTTNYINLSILTAKKNQSPTWEPWSGVIPPLSDPSLPRSLNFLPLFDWQFVLATSPCLTNAITFGSNGTVWKPWELPEPFVINTPLSANQKDTFIVGSGYDFTATTPVIIERDGTQVPPQPIIYTLTSDGVLLLYHIASLNPSRPSLNKSVDPCDLNAMKNGEQSIGFQPLATLQNGEQLIGYKITVIVALCDSKGAELDITAFELDPKSMIKELQEFVCRLWNFTMEFLRLSVNGEPILFPGVAVGEILKDKDLVCARHVHLNFWDNLLQEAELFKNATVLKAKNEYAEAAIKSYRILLKSNFFDVYAKMKLQRHDFIDTLSKFLHKTRASIQQASLVYFETLFKDKNPKIEFSSPDDNGSRAAVMCTVKLGSEVKVFRVKTNHEAQRSDSRGCYDLDLVELYIYKLLESLGVGAEISFIPNQVCSEVVLYIASSWIADLKLFNEEGISHDMQALTNALVEIQFLGAFFSLADLHDENIGIRNGMAPAIVDFSIGNYHNPMEKFFSTNLITLTVDTYSSLLHQCTSEQRTVIAKTAARRWNLIEKMRTTLTDMDDIKEKFCRKNLKFNKEKGTEALKKYVEKVVSNVEMLLLEDSAAKEAEESKRKAELEEGQKQKEAAEAKKKAAEEEKEKKEAEEKVEQERLKKIAEEQEEEKRKAATASGSPFGGGTSAFAQATKSPFAAATNSSSSPTTSAFSGGSSGFSAFGNKAGVFGAPAQQATSNSQQQNPSGSTSASDGNSDFVSPKQ